MKQFKIHILSRPDESNGNRCKARTNAIPQATSLNDYECMDCKDGGKEGSFLRISQDVTDVLTICDIKVYGEFISNRGITFLLNSS